MLKTRNTLLKTLLATAFISKGLGKLFDRNLNSTHITVCQSAGQKVSYP